MLDAQARRGSKRALRGRDGGVCHSQIDACRQIYDLVILVIGGRLRGCTWPLGASGDMRCDTGIAIGAVGSNGAAGGTAPPEMAMRAGVTSWFRAGRKG